MPNLGSPLVAELLADPRVGKEIKKASSITPACKEALLAHLNRLVESRECSRDELETLFKGALASPKETAYFLTDRLCWFTVAGTIIGARLGEVFFYNWPYYSKHPIEIFKTWHGGLASHGGVIGVAIALYLYRLYIRRWLPELTFLRILDYVAIPSALVAFFIRMGNFMNQEILGTPTTLPWGVIFGHPEGEPLPIARHPVQRYEGLAYLMTFFILWFYWKKKKELEKPGAIVGLLLSLFLAAVLSLNFGNPTRNRLFWIFPIFKWGID